MTNDLFDQSQMNPPYLRVPSQVMHYWLFNCTFFPFKQHLKVPGVHEWTTHVHRRAWALTGSLGVLRGAQKYHGR